MPVSPKSLSIPFSFLLIFGCCQLYAQRIDSLNTAASCTYMSEPEKEMLYEINRLRSNPKCYLEYLLPMLKDAKEDLKMLGKGNRNYSLTISTTVQNGKETIKTDTTWHFVREEEVKALQSLINDINKLKPLSVLKPDSGIYLAVRKHIKDQSGHEWKLMHTGSDGSLPWDRITTFSPNMSFGNENIAGNTMQATPRDFVLQLLIDSGIPGYGHRYNLLDPQWTHGACSTADYEGMHWWIQNFGKVKNYPSYTSKNE